MLGGRPLFRREVLFSLTALLLKVKFGELKDIQRKLFLVPSLLRRNHEISILKGDEKRFTVYINPITMQIYSDFF